MIKFVRGVCVLALVGLMLMGNSALTWAHTHLVKSIPVNGSTLAVSPSRFVLTFAEPAKLTTLSLQKDAEPAQKMGPLPTSPATEVSIPAPQLAPGRYVLAWRAVGDDGHVMPGKLSFTVGPAG